jgi:8-oxo-dGTP diphosphatase
VPIFLVRHAHAGKRSEWSGDDTRRPLSPRGETQAKGIAELLEGRDMGRVVSSPYLRCAQTVEPLTGADLTLELDERLAEGASVDEALALVLELDAVRGVACSHGDIIPAVLEELVARGMTIDGPMLHQKGSVWTIETTDGRPVRATYTPPSA